MTIPDTLMKEMIRVLKHDLSVFRLMNARQTRNWFMYGNAPIPYDLSEGVSLDEPEES